MKLQFISILMLLSNLLSSQTVTSLNKDSVIKNDLIYFRNHEVYSTSNWQTYSGENKGSATSRSLIFDFKVGVDGDITNIGRRGKRLKEIIKKDSLALKEFNRAYKVHLRKKRLANSAEYVCYALAAGSAILLFVGLDDGYDKVNGLTIGGGAGVLASFAGIYAFYRITDKQMDSFAASLNKSVNVYNQNLLSKCR